MGAVYQLILLDPLAPTLALKTLGIVRDQEGFAREAEAWLSLTGSAHIAEALRYGWWQDMPSILCRWYSTVASHAHFASMTTDEAVPWLTGLVTGLSTAYQRGILHRDVKPSNILIGDVGEARVCDFGLASLRAGERPSMPMDRVDFRELSQVTVGSVAGTLPYMAPELLQGERPSISTEMYALGVTIFELATGEHPYAGAETAWRFRPKLRLSAIEGVPADLRERLAPLLTALVDLDPSRRPTSYEAVAARLGPLDSGATFRTAEGIVAQASYLRKRGRGPDAIDLLERELASGRDPVLLNALGAAYLEASNVSVAQATFAEATEWLSRHDWEYHGKAYPDPIVNLARLHINAGEHEQASDLLGVVDELPLLTMRYSYPELGWLRLWRAEPEAAAEFFGRCLRGWGVGEADSRALAWVVLAMELSGQGSVHAAAVIEHVQAPFDDLTTLTTLAVASWCDTDQRRQVMAMISPQRLAELTRAAPQLELTADDLVPPISDGAAQLLIASLDKEATGGKLVRTLAERIHAGVRWTGEATSLDGPRELPDAPGAVVVVEQGFTAAPAQKMTTYAAVVENQNQESIADRVPISIRFFNPEGAQVGEEEASLLGLMPGQRAAVGGEIDSGSVARIEVAVERIEPWDWKPAEPGMSSAFSFSPVTTELEEWGELRISCNLVSNSDTSRDLVHVVAVHRHAGAIVGGDADWVEVPARGTVALELSTFTSLPSDITTEMYADGGVDGHDPSSES